MPERWAYVANLGFRSRSVYMFGGVSLGGWSHSSFSGFRSVREVTTGFEVISRDPSTSVALARGFSCGGPVGLPDDPKGIVIGGASGASNILDANLRYTPADSNGGEAEWDERADHPVTIREAAAATISTSGLDYVYVSGGRETSSGSPVDVVRRFQDGNNTWTDRQAMGTARKLHSMVSADTKAYSLCGHTSTAMDDDYLNTIEEYDHGTDAWAAKQADSGESGFGGRVGVGACHNNGTIYAIGGQHLQGSPLVPVPVGSVRKYDVTGDSWSAGQEPQRNRAFADAPFRAGRILRLAGQQAYSGKFFQADMQSYDVAGDAWTEHGAWPNNGTGWERKAGPTFGL